MEKDLKLTIKSIITEVCYFYGEKPLVEFAVTDNRIEINLKVSEQNNLIGTDGDGLVALQHLLRLIYRQKIGKRPNFIIDVNNYRRKRKEHLFELAKTTARQAFEENKLMILKPMNAFERRLVHVALADDERVKTQSLGQDYERRVIVKPQK